MAAKGSELFLISGYILFSLILSILFTAKIIVKRKLHKEVSFWPLIARSSVCFLVFFNIFMATNYLIQAIPLQTDFFWSVAYGSGFLAAVVFFATAAWSVLIGSTTMGEHILVFRNVCLFLALALLIYLSIVYLVIPFFII